MKHLSTVVLLLAVAHAAVGKCPIGTVQGVNDDDCYYFNAAPTMWLKAEENCIARNGHLASISSTIGNSVLRQIGSLSCAKEFWLGGSYDTELSNQWSWTDGRRFTYTNWASGQPVNVKNNCIAIDVTSGRWYSRSSDVLKPYICKVPAVGGPTAASTTPAAVGTCPTGWTYVAAVEGKCIRITDQQGYWSDTWSMCKQLGGDLISIHSNASNFALVDFAFNKMGIADDDHLWFAIGLHKQTLGGQWQWTDGSAVSYTNWQPGYTDDSPSTSYLGVFGRADDQYATYNGFWEGDQAGVADWAGICEWKPL